MSAGSNQHSIGVHLAGTGMALPGRVVSNADLSRLIETSDDWITQRTGIKQRYVVSDGQTVRDLARQAVADALQDAGVQAKQLNLLICATMTPEMCCPSTAARIVDELGAAPAGAFDISVACSGFVYALNVAESLIRSGLYQHIAVVGAEALSTIVDWKDRRTCVLFGDGAGAVILSASDAPEQGSLHHTMSSKGSLWHILYCPRTDSQLPPGNEFSGAHETLQMNGREVYKFAVTTMISAIRQTLKACQLEPDDLAMIISHQSNKRILESARSKLRLPEEKLYINIDRFANTSAASVPLCLHELRTAERIGTGDLVMFVALGGGMSWATNLWRL
jgi:3-oxoacyl-[acyl-carrier-protein] synthase-3